MALEHNGQRLVSKCVGSRNSYRAPLKLHGPLQKQLGDVLDIIVTPLLNSLGITDVMATSCQSSAKASQMI